MDEFASYQSFAQVYDEFMDQTPYRLWGENIRQYLRKYKVKDGADVLDLGCGTGRMTNLLALLHPADAVISTCDSLNYILEPEDLIQVFVRVRENLKEDGVFLFDMNTLYKYETLLAENTFAEDREECSFIWQNFYDQEDGINEYDLTLFIRMESGLYQKFEEVHFQRAYETEEIKEALRLAGFEIREVVDADTLKEPETESERLYFISTINHEVDK